MDSWVCGWRDLFGIELILKSTLKSPFTTTLDGWVGGWLWVVGWLETQFQQTPFWTKSTRCLVVSWSNFNSKSYFKQLCPLKSQNPTYGSQVTAISAPPPGLNRVKMKWPTSMSRRDKIIFSWWMVQAGSNDIKKWRFCWLHPPRKNYFVSSWDKKTLPPPHHEKIILSRRDTFQNIKQVPIIWMYLHSKQCKIIIENIPIEWLANIGVSSLAESEYHW